MQDFSGIPSGSLTLAEKLGVQRYQAVIIKRAFTCCLGIDGILLVFVDTTHLPGLGLPVGLTCKDCPQHLLRDGPELSSK